MTQTTFGWKMLIITIWNCSWKVTVISYEGKPWKVMIYQLIEILPRYSPFGTSPIEAPTLIVIHAILSTCTRVFFICNVNSNIRSDCQKAYFGQRLTLSHQLSVSVHNLPRCLFYSCFFFRESSTCCVSMAIFPVNAGNEKT